MVSKRSGSAGLGGVFERQCECGAAIGAVRMEGWWLGDWVLGEKCGSYYLFTRQPEADRLLTQRHFNIQSQPLCGTKVQNKGRKWRGRKRVLNGGMDGGFSFKAIVLFHGGKGAYSAAFSRFHWRAALCSKLRPNTGKTTPENFTQLHSADVPTCMWSCHRVGHISLGRDHGNTVIKAKLYLELERYMKDVKMSSSQ